MTEDGPSMAEALMFVIETLAPVRDAVMGYRAELINLGVGPDIADTMAADIHNFIIKSMMTQLQGV